MRTAGNVIIAIGAGLALAGLMDLAFGPLLAGLGIAFVGGYIRGPK